MLCILVRIFVRISGFVMWIWGRLAFWGAQRSQYGQRERCRDCFFMDPKMLFRPKMKFSVAQYGKPYARDLFQRRERQTKKRKQIHKFLTTFGSGFLFVWLRTIWLMSSKVLLVGHFLAFNTMQSTWSGRNKKKRILYVLGLFVSWRTCLNGPMACICEFHECFWYARELMSKMQFPCVRFRHRYDHHLNGNLVNVQR